MLSRLFIPEGVSFSLGYGVAIVSVRNAAQLSRCTTQLGGKGQYVEAASEVDRR